MNKQDTPIRTSLKLMRHNFLQISIAMAIIKAISISALQFVIKRVFRLMLLEANIQGLNNDNFMAVLNNPLALIFLFLILALVSIFMIAEVMILTLLFNKSYSGEKINYRLIANKVRGLIHPSFILFVLYVLLVMPNMNLGVSASFAANISVPQFIIKFFYEHQILTLLYITVLVILFILNLFLFYAPAIYVLEKGSFIDACKKSYDLTHKRPIRSLLLVLKLSVITTALGIVASVMMAGVSVILRTLLPFAPHVVYSLSATTLLFMVVFIIAFSQILVYQVVVVSYHQRIGSPDPIILKRNRNKQKETVFLVVLVAAFSIMTVGIYFTETQDPLPRDTQVIAHRGNTTLAIENTLESLKYAALDGADIVEMDVQRSIDGGLFVYHDATLRRFTGMNTRVSTLTLEEIMSVELNDGDYTSRIPSFEEYMELAKLLDQKILIEIKPDSNKAPNYIHEVVKVVEDLEMENMVYYQSLDKNLMLNLEKSYPGVITGYIIGFNIGNLEQVDVDFYSLEASAVSHRVVQTLSIWNKGLFVWTVNSPQDIRTFINMRVSGIITNRADVAIEVRETSAPISIIERIWQLLP